MSTGPTPELKDFLMTWAPRKQSPEDVLAIFRGLASRWEEGERGDDR